MLASRVAHLPVHIFSKIMVLKGFASGVAHLPVHIFSKNMVLKELEKTP